MACITLLAPMAMATTQLARVVEGENVQPRQMNITEERDSLRMSWVVATDNDGNRCLRMHWASTEGR